MKSCYHWFINDVVLAFAKMIYSHSHICLQKNIKYGTVQHYNMPHMHLLASCILIVRFTIFQVEQKPQTTEEDSVLFMVCFIIIMGGGTAL